MGGTWLPGELPLTDDDSGEGAVTAGHPLPGQRSPPLLAIIVDGEEEWEVEHVLDSRLFYR